MNTLKENAVLTATGAAVATAGTVMVGKRICSQPQDGSRSGFMKWRSSKKKNKSKNLFERFGISGMMIFVVVFLLVDAIIIYLLYCLCCAKSEDDSFDPRQGLVPGGYGLAPQSVNMLQGPPQIMVMDGSLQAQPPVVNAPVQNQQFMAPNQAQHGQAGAMIDDILDNLDQPAPHARPPGGFPAHGPL